MSDKPFQIKAIWKEVVYAKNAEEAEAKAIKALTNEINGYHSSRVAEPFVFSVKEIKDWDNHKF